MTKNTLNPSDPEARPPLIIDLPHDKTAYFRILDKADAFTMRSGLVTLEPGKEVGSHNTDDYEECLIVLDGSGEIETENLGRRKIRAGQVAYNPPHTRHNVINSSNQPMRYIYIVAKAFTDKL